MIQAKPKNDGLNIAYIDGASLHMGIKSAKENLDYKRFRRWLSEKYKITTAYIFMGYIKKQKPLYDYLSKCGFELIFRETVSQQGLIKGNIDSEMVLQSVRDFFEKDIKNVILISGDGDFSCLVDFLIEKNVFKAILIPNIKYCSYLLKKKNVAMVRLDHPRLMPLFTKEERTLARDLPL